MKKIDLGQSVQILANIGVLGGIVFLGYELRQMNLATRLDAAENHTERANAIDQFIVENPRLLDDVNREDPDYQHLISQKLYLNRMRYRDWQVTFFQYQEGVLDERFFEAFQVEVQIALWAGDANWGGDRRGQYHSDFRDFMDAQSELSDSVFDRLRSNSVD